MGFAELVAAADRVAIKLLGDSEPVIYAPSPLGLPFPLGAPFTLSPVTVTGIFDAKFVLVKGDTPAGVETVGPAVFLRFEDLPTDPEVDDPSITIRGVAYHVTERQPDDMGGIVLFLRRAT